MSASGTGGHASPISPSGDDAAKQSSPVKRKHDGEGIAQPRAKRNRYISIAWYGITLHIKEKGTSERTKANFGATATSANAAKSSAMAKPRVSAAAICRSNASMRRIAVAMGSRTRSKLEW